MQESEAANKPRNATREIPETSGAWERAWRFHDRDENFRNGDCPSPLERPDTLFKIRMASREQLDKNGDDTRALTVQRPPGDREEARKERSEWNRAVSRS